MTFELPPGFGLLVIPVLFFWALGVPRHRTPSTSDKIKINPHVARLLGSPNAYVDRHTLSNQIGVASILLWYPLFALLGFPASLGWSAFASMLVILGLRWTITFLE
jgi:hypothetical protein